MTREQRARLLWRNPFGPPLVGLTMVLLFVVVLWLIGAGS
jgi:hypothetical protein